MKSKKTRKPDESMSRAERVLVSRRLAIIMAARKNGNVSRTCRERGMNRMCFYKFLRRFQKYGRAGLKNLSSAPHHHPTTTPPRLVKKALVLSRKNPKWGGRKIADKLCESQTVSISHETVRNILNKNGLRTRQDRLRKFRRPRHTTGQAN